MSGEIEAVVRGHLAADAVVKTLPTGQVVAELRVGSSVQRKAGDEWLKVRTDWVDVTVWGHRVNAVAKLLKGQLVEVRGRLTPTAYLTKEGEAAPSLSVSAFEALVVPTVPRAAAPATVPADQYLIPA